MNPKPTDIPAADRRTVLVIGARAARPNPRPTTLANVFRTAARIIAANGHHQGDYLPDPFNRALTTPHSERPMSLAAAIRCAATGDPHGTSALSEEAIRVLAYRLQVDGEGPLGDRPFWMESHLADWGDLPGRTTESAVAVLEAAGDAVEVAA